MSKPTTSDIHAVTWTSWVRSNPARLHLGTAGLEPYFLAVLSTIYWPLLARILKSHSSLASHCVFFLLFSFHQDFRNSQAGNAEGGLEAFHQPLPPEERPVAGTGWASSSAVRARPTRHQSHGGQRGQTQTVKHRRTHQKAQNMDCGWKNLEQQKTSSYKKHKPTVYLKKKKKKEARIWRWFYYFLWMILYINFNGKIFTFWKWLIPSDTQQPLMMSLY